MKPIHIYLPSTNQSLRTNLHRWQPTKNNLYWMTMLDLLLKWQQFGIGPVNNCTQL